VKNFTVLDVQKHFPHAVARTYSAGQIIIYHGDTPNHVMFIESGAVKFYDTDTDGNEKIMHISGAGGLIPLFYSFEDKPSVDAFYATITETKIWLVPITEFHNKLKTDAPYSFATLRRYAEELDHIVLRLKSLEKSSAKQKILQAFHYLGQQHATRNRVSNEWYRINFPLTQQTLADMTGLTRETVNITLKDPDVLRVIRIKRHTFEINCHKISEALE